MCAIHQNIKLMEKLLLVLSEVVVDAMRKATAKLMLRSSSDHRHSLTRAECHMDMQVNDISME
jgi:hypothetical protein